MLKRFNLLFPCLFLLSGIYAADAFAKAAPAGGPPQPSFAEMLLRMTPMLVMVYFVFYFLVIRPQQTRLRSQEAMLESLKKGDQVVTSGGIIGRVAGTAEDHVLVEVAGNVKVKFRRSKIIEKVEKKKESGKEK